MSLPELLIRVKEAKGPDRELDATVHKKLVGLCLRYYVNPTGPFYYALPRYTLSIDAALALVERKLPGWRGDIDTAPFEPGDLCGARFFPPGKITNIAEQAATPPLAILAAILSALIATTPAAGGR